ncbi:MAG: zinc ribbon domain-containing protein [Promethearchaeota archaeon]
MNFNRMNPKYCPRCRKELVSSQSFCSNCGYNKRNEEIFERFRRNASIRVKKNGEDLEKRHIKIGGVMSGLTLLGLLGFSGIFTGFPWVYLIFIAPWVLPSLLLALFPLNFIITFSVNIYGIRLFFFSLNQRSKGFFLIIYGIGQFFLTIILFLFFLI